MRRSALACLVALAALAGSPSPTHAQECNQRTLDLFDLSRRARNILVEINRAEAQYEEAIALYEEELPSTPGYLGWAGVFQTSSLGSFPVCAADGTRSLDLSRSRAGGRFRWMSDDSTMLLELTVLSSTQTLSKPGTKVTTNAEGKQVLTPTSTSYLADSQSYYGARVRLNAWIDLTLGVLDIGGVRAGEAGAQLPLSGSDTPGLRTYTRVAVPALNGASVEFIIGDALSRPESAIVALPFGLPHGLAGFAQAAWLGDESRAVLRGGVRDPWDILQADLGFETSSAVFRHARLRGRYLSGPVLRFPSFAAAKDGEPDRVFTFGDRLVHFYTRWGAFAEVSRFSGRHFEDITGQSGATGWTLQGMMVFHQIVLPIRAQIRIGAGRNRVDLLEHAAAFVDRQEFLADFALTLGW